MLYTIKDNKTGEYFLEIQYHGEVGFYPMFTKEITTIYTHASKAQMDYRLLHEMYNQVNTIIVPIKATEEDREIKTKEYYK